MRVHRGVHRPKEEALLAALGLGIGIVAIIVIVLIILAILWFARRT